MNRDCTWTSSDETVAKVENGVVKGMDETHFEPETVCTRAQALTFLWRANGMPQPKTTTNPFVDVDASAYYYDAVSGVSRTASSRAWMRRTLSRIRSASVLTP